MKTWLTLTACPCLIAGDPSDRGGIVTRHTPHWSRVNGYCFSCQLSMKISVEFEWLAEDEIQTEFSANIHRFRSGCPFFHMNLFGLLVEMNPKMFVSRSEDINTLFFSFQLSNNLLKDMITETRRAIWSMNLDWFSFLTVVESHPGRVQDTDRVEVDNSTVVRQHWQIHWWVVKF